MEIDALPAAGKSSKTPKILAGIFLILLGLVLGYFFVYAKVQEMKLQQDITYHMKLMILVPFCIVFGLYYIAFTPEGAGSWKELTQKQKPWFVAALVISALATVGLAYWFNSQLTAYGYEGIFK